MGWSSGSRARRRREIMLMRRSIYLVWLLVVLACSSATAQQWARKMFETTSHDFGTVAAGAKAEYKFVLKNIYLKEVHVAGVRHSCGCVDVRIEKPHLKTYEKGAIVATVDSNSMRGQRSSTITVVIDKPYYAEVRLVASVYIRGDVTLEPSGILFGSVDRGDGAEKKITVTRYGRSDWKILDAECENPHLSAKLAEKGRWSNQVSYDLNVRLDKDAPAGYLRDQITLVTNDSWSGRIPVMVEGRVLPRVTVAPASLFLGVTKPGQQVKKQFVVRGKQPFGIRAITCDDGRFTFGFNPSSEEAAKKQYLVPVTFTAGKESGAVKKTVRVETDLDGAVAELTVYGVVAEKE